MAEVPWLVNFHDLIVASTSDKRDVNSSNLSEAFPITVFKHAFTDLTSLQLGTKIWWTRRSSGHHCCHATERSPGSSLSQWIPLRYISWKRHFTLIMNGIKKPMGSNILAEDFKTLLLLFPFPYRMSIRCLRSKTKSSESGLHTRPSIFSTQPWASASCVMQRSLFV